MAIVAAAVDAGAGVRRRRLITFALCFGWPILKSSDADIVDVDARWWINSLAIDQALR